MKKKLTSVSYIRKIYSLKGFKVSKSLGQNFLIDENTVNKIIESSGVSKDDWVIEIGAGFGALTQKLLERAKKVTSIEIDKRLYPILKELFIDEKNLELIRADFMTIDLKSFVKEGLDKIHDFNGKVRIVANLPYYISTPIMMKILHESQGISSATLMLQKEVAQRICAVPNTRAYGILSIMTQIIGEPKIDFIVPKTVFLPIPKVSSAVITINLEEKKNLMTEAEKKHFTNIVKTSFSQRRKTLLNSLSSGGVYTKQQVVNALNKMNLDLKIRAENLSIQNFIDLIKEL